MIAAVVVAAHMGAWPLACEIVTVPQENHIIFLKVRPENDSCSWIQSSKAVCSLEKEVTEGRSIKKNISRKVQHWTGSWRLLRKHARACLRNWKDFLRLPSSIYSVLRPQPDKSSKSEWENLAEPFLFLWNPYLCCSLPKTVQMCKLNN